MKINIKITILFIFCVFILHKGISQDTWVIKNMKNSRLANNLVKVLFEDSKGNIWVGTKNGLNTIRGENWDLIYKTDGLSNNIVTDINEVASGEIWVSTYKGITVFNGKNLKIIRKEEGLLHNKTFSIEVDSRNRVWVGTKKGVSVFDGKTWRTYTIKNGLINNWVFDILEDKTGKIWFATRKGVSVFDGLNWKSYTKKDGLSRNFVWSIDEDRDGNIWFGTHTGAFCKFDINSNWEVIKKGSGYYDPNLLLVGAVDGVLLSLVFSPAFGATFFIVSAGLGFLPSPVHATSVFVDSNNNIWLAAQPKGVYMYNQKDWIHYSSNSGLPSNYIFDIIETKKGEIWFGTKRGIAIMKK